MKKSLETLGLVATDNKNIINYSMKPIKRTLNLESRPQLVLPRKKNYEKTY